MKIKLTPRLKSGLLGLACACAAVFAIPVHAQITTNVIFGTDFDGDGNWAYSYQFAFAGGGTPNADVTPAPVNGGANTPGVGVAGSSAYLASVDYTTVGSDPIYTNASSYTFAGFAQVGNFSTPINALAPTANLTDIILSFDVKVEGLLTNLTTTGVAIQELILSSGGPTTFKFQNSGNTAGSNYVHFEIPLSDMSLVQGSATDFTNSAIVAGIDAMKIEFRVEGQVGTLNVDRSPVYGFDNDNSLVVDNIYLKQVAGVVAPPTPPTVAGPRILDYNFDNLPIWWAATANWSAVNPAGLPIPTANIANPGYGVGGSNAWAFAFDTSNFADPNTPAWAGCNTFGGGPGNYPEFNTSALASYRITFDCRLEGLAPDITNSSFLAGMSLRAPDDTLLPADGNTDPDELVGLSFGFSAGTNWQTVSFLLSQGVAGAGSKANFTNYFSQINGSQLEFKIENSIITNYEFDNNNVLSIDNYKLERLYVATPPLSVQIVGSNAVVTWAQPNTGTAKLQSSTTVNGTYTDVIGATSPYPSPIASGPKYFRTQWVAP